MNPIGKSETDEALRESQARLEEELADSRLVQTISAEIIHENNLDALYQKILDAAVHIMRSDYASMQMYYPERGTKGELRLLASHGFTAEAVKFWEWVRADSHCSCGIALRTGQRCIVPDVKRCDLMTGTEDQRQLLRAGILAAQSTPLVSRNGKLVGMITTHWRMPHEPSERSIRLLDIVARQAADLIERCRAMEEIQALNERLADDVKALERLQQIRTRILGSDDLKARLTEILAAAAHITGTGRGNIQLYDPGANRLRLAVSQGFGDRFVQRFEDCAYAAVCKAAGGDLAPAMWVEIAAEPALQGTEELQVLLEEGIKAIQSTPLISLDGRLLGRLNNYFGVPCRPRDRVLRHLDLLTRMAADFVERANYEQALRDSEEKLRHSAATLEERVTQRTQELILLHDRLRALATELTLTEQRERKRFASELHDHLQQLLVLAKMRLKQADRRPHEDCSSTDFIREVDDVLSEALAYTRTLVSELSPPVLRDHGVAAALRWLGEYMARKYGMRVAVTAPENEPLRMPEDQAVLLFQSVRELLINTSKHAGTQEAWVAARTENGTVIIEVSDEGVGFDIAAVNTSPTSFVGSGISSKFGLFNIDERMRAIGGSIQVESTPGKGTKATLTLPFSREPHPGGSPLALSVSRTGPAIPNRGSKDNHGRQTQSNAVITVVLVDDHAVLRQGLRSLLENYDDVEVVGEASDGEQAVNIVERERPTLVVMDMNMPKLNGIEATRRITAFYPDVTVIGLSVNTDDENHDAMLRAGAKLAVNKEAAFEQLYDAIQAAIEPRCNG
jgi:signal transduction histidine kinase/ActR/RegA family two-component response regulator